MNQYLFNVRLSYEQLLPIYNGGADKIVVRDFTGRTIELAAKHFKPFLTRQGINGDFKLLTETSGKFHSLTRLS
ncbi:MAG: DUF2835 family protein [Gammaproteobacteria bacterium]|nr:DUF2835 family protein [Gammaproteobacteria bacterium]